jgi:hypothetical protein
VCVLGVSVRVLCVAFHGKSRAFACCVLACASRVLVREQAFSFVLHSSFRRRLIGPHFAKVLVGRFSTAVIIGAAACPRC